VGEYRNARASIREALRDFHWLEYLPFGLIMLAELLFVTLAMNLGKPWGMGGAGWIMRTAGEPAVHYPASFVFLISAYARVESFLFAVAGSFLIPLSLARIMAPMEGAPQAGSAVTRRARRAYLATFLGYVMNFALLIAWEFLLQAGPRRLFSMFLGGIKGDVLTWCVGVLGAFSIAAIFLYVPIRAVEEGTSLGEALWGGIKEGFRLFGPTLLIVLVFVWPTLLFLAPLQLRPTLLVTRFRPELIAVFIAIAATLNSFVNYFIYSAAARLHWLSQKRREA
jgi:hypothetical protein